MAQWIFQWNYQWIGSLEFTNNRSSGDLVSLRLSFLSRSLFWWNRRSWGNVTRSLLFRQLGRNRDKSRLNDLYFIRICSFEELRATLACHPIRSACICVDDEKKRKLGWEWFKIEKTPSDNLRRKYSYVVSAKVVQRHCSSVYSWKKCVTSTSILEQVLH